MSSVILIITTTRRAVHNRLSLRVSRLGVTGLRIARLGLGIARLGLGIARLRVIGNGIHLKLKRKLKWQFHNAVRVIRGYL